MELAIEKKDDLFKLLHDYNYIVHSHDNGEYNYLEDDDVSIELLNESGTAQVYIDLEDEFTLTMGTYHGHYFCSEEQYQKMVSDLFGYLEGKVCAVSAYYYDNDKLVWNLSCLRETENCNQDVSKMLALINNVACVTNLKNNGGEIRFDFWKPNSRYILKVEKE